MEDLFGQLLQAVVAAAVPVLGTYLVKLLGAWKDKLVAQATSERQKGYLAQIADAVATAVDAVAQTYSEDLKLAGTFGKEQHAMALERAIAIAKRLLSASCLEFMEDVSGDATEYLRSQIEAAVWQSANGPDVLVEKM